MKKIVLALAMVISLIACTNDATNTMKLKGNIEGLRLGTLYFQRMNDTAVVNIDTVTFKGDGKFEFSLPLEEPEVFYLYLDKKDGNPMNDRLMVFGEPGEINIETTREYFDVNAKITGSKTQDTYNEYKKSKSRFTDKNLELLEDRFKALKAGDEKKADSLSHSSDMNTKRSYLYSINFCLNNKDSEVSPYVALSDLYNAQIKYLDTINNSLTSDIAQSKYGKALNTFVKDIKEKETSETAE
ncbi:protein of unknown function [Pustulibacterium marinum]|uniref:DUF4369 domain-containing protein n=1 Tax=Pustulibacterium marinum TaxID=1224947 RepID=A0A1I7FC01_9FLAO|nr:DUF4369 domain-containing protein [Pustulibacterium marinum]SFU33728.1 protein of unknown function [Pustulibacterium marinum]